NAYFTQHPDDAKRAEIQFRISEAEAAASAGEALINGGAAVTSGDVAQAFGDFEAAYQDAVTLAKDLGIVSAPLGSRVGVEKVAGRLVVPSAEALIPSGVDMKKVSARVQAVRALDVWAHGAALSLRSPGAGKQAEPPLRWTAITLTEESLIPWAPVAVLHADGRIESAWLPQWLAVPVAMELATR
ncbi:MAG TPA: hypothetical protein VN962_04290, partial [Polyangia bacterium]|nr:hypothetical protein [Polyangia bacterium]